MIETPPEQGNAIMRGKRSHHVQIARTENVTSRQPCHEFTPFAYKTLENLILKHPMGTAQHHCPYY